MKRIFLILIIIITGSGLFAQNTFKYPINADGGIRIGGNARFKVLICPDTTASKSSSWWVANTTYIINCNVNLGGATIIFPANVNLWFNGGIFSNGTLQGNNTSIQAVQIQTFKTNMVFTGTWVTNEVSPVWWGAVSDWNNADSTATDCTAYFNDAIQFFNRSAIPYSGIYDIWGQGTVKIPKGIWLINGTLTSNNTNSWIGLKIIGESQYATQIVTTVDNVTMFNIDTYIGLEISDITFQHITHTNRSTWTNICFDLNGAGGGNDFLLSRVSTKKFYRIIKETGTVNQDNTIINDCIACDCVVWLESDNGEAYGNEINNCTWYGNIDYAFYVRGFSQTKINTATTDMKGTFLYLKNINDGLLHNASEFIFENCRWEFGDYDDNTYANKYAKILDANGDYIYSDIKFINCGLSGGTVAHDSAIFMSIGSPVRITIEGGKYNGRLKLTTNVNNFPNYVTGITFDRVLFDHLPSTIMKYGTTASSKMWSTVSYNNCGKTSPSSSRITDILLSWIDGTSTGLPSCNPTRTMAVWNDYANTDFMYQAARGTTSLITLFYGQRVVIEKIDLFLSIAPTDTTIFSIYSNAAKSTLIARDTLLNAEVTAPCYLHLLEVDHPITADGVYWDIYQRAGHNIGGHFILQYTSL